MSKVSAEYLQAPIVIIGMHRSGTSMIARALERLGLFVGWRKQRDHEALFFFHLNKWLLRQSNASWERPTPMADLLGNEEVRPLVGDYLRFSLRSPRCVSYLGPGHYLRYRSVDRLPVPWGWKDPRNTFTLPIWLDLFPRAKVVNVYRHGVDVAESLLQRYRRDLAARTERYRRTRAQYLLRAKELGFSWTMRSATLEGGLALWEEYMREAAAQVEARGERGLSLRYEDFQSDPKARFERLVEFCQLDPPPGALSEVVADVRAERAYAYRRSDTLKGFAREHAARLADFGY